MAEKTALDLLNEVLPPIPGAAQPEVEEEEVVTPEGEETEVEETPPEGEETEEGDEKPEVEETDEEKPEVEEETDEVEETDEEKATREAAEKEGGRQPPDDLNDPIPTTLSERTQGRITRLVDRVKDLEPRAAQGDELLGYIRETGMNADEFAMSLTYGKLLHSDNIEDNRKAFQILLSEMKGLAPKIGEALPWADPLEGHDDLKARVAAKTLDLKDAAELAGARNRVKAEQAAQARANQNRAAASDRAAQTAQLEQRCREDLNELGAQLQAVDTQFEAKMAALKKAPKGPDGMTPMQKIAAAPPQLRVNAFLKAFRAIKLNRQAQQRPAAGGRTVNQPLRGHKVPAAAAGGVKTAPKTAMEALNRSLGIEE